MFFEDFYEISNEKVVIVKVIANDNSDADFSEIESLVNVLGGEVVGYIRQKREFPDNRFFIGSGKISEIIEEIKKTGANFVIFDNNLKPSQVYNLEKVINKKIFDRSEVILEIFRKHARTKEAQLEIELARLKYIAPRLKRMWRHLEQISGRMMAGRGPGEQQIESDRRLIKKRIKKIEDEIKEITQHKEHLIENREKYLTCSILGYTNAGKTTIFNILTGLSQKTSTELFTTLDTKISMLKLKNNIPIYLVDTVGFIKEMPEHLLRAFYTTLKEAISSDILILVFDVSRENFDQQIENVEKIISELKINPEEKIYIFNKIDKVADELKLISYARKYENREPLFISALKDNIKKILIEKLSTITDKMLKTYRINIDITNGKLINFLHNYTQVVTQATNKNKLIYEVRAHPVVIKKILDDYNTEVEIIV
ncbi:MAG: GTPase HflX [Planctomycetota bacterium]